MANVVWPNGSISVPTVSSEFGPRKSVWTGSYWSSSFHAGIDLIRIGTIRAAAPATVTFAGYNGGAGLEARIRADGPNAFVKGDVFRYLHNSVLHVRAGQRVAQGQAIAEEGNTGASTGKHCHFEVRPEGGVAVNPRDYFATANAGTAGSTKPPAPTSEERQVITILEIKGDSNAAKSLYDVRTGKAIREISKAENSSFRIAEQRGAAVYVSVDKAEYLRRGGLGVR